VKTSQLILFGMTLASGLVLADDRVRLALVVQFPEAVPVETRVAMERELLETVQVEWLGIEWREQRRYDSSEPFDQVLALRVRGECSATAAGLTAKGALGITHVSDGKILPFIEVDCDRVARAIEPRVFPHGSLAARPALGRAMGRVAAHELYHVLAATMDHQPEGLARAHFGYNELLLLPLRLSGDLLKREKPLAKQGD
jgi:hypothetical protein